MTSENTDYEQYQEAKREADAALEELKKAEGISDSSRKLFRVSIHRLKSDIAEEFTRDRIACILRHIMPEHLWSLPENEKPLRLYKLRHWCSGFGEFRFVRLHTSFEVTIEQWCGDPETIYMPFEWFEQSWDALVPILNKHMQDEWDDVKEADRILALARAEADLKSAQARIDELKGK